jgi:SAM-dependent methyltransferase
MPAECQATAEFYATPRGAMVARLLRDRLAALWPSLPGQSVLGLGYAAPYLRLWRAEAQRCVAVLPAQACRTSWPPGEASLTCAVEEGALPFPDLSFDRILLVHGLEAAEHARRLLREVWRVLKDDGRLIIVAPNRRGMWAYVESTPFGHGQPYSAGQIGRLLGASMFRVERRDAALFMPPVRLRLAVGTARLWESGARMLLPIGIAGLTITEAVKDVYAAVPLAEAAPSRRLVLADTWPAAARTPGDHQHASRLTAPALGRIV